MTKRELQEILEQHRQWVAEGRKGGPLRKPGANSIKGQRADFRGADLRGADLRGAFLVGANLVGANFSDADFTDAILVYANLSNANLRGTGFHRANLRYAIFDSADLYYANLSEADFECANLVNADFTHAILNGAHLNCANLRGANFSCAELRRATFDGTELSLANLVDIKRDFFEILKTAPAEIPALRQALVDGKIDGQVYSGECCCLVGTIAKARGVSVDTLKRHPRRPAERWFLAIQPGMSTTHPVVAITLQWVAEFMAGER